MNDHTSITPVPTPEDVDRTMTMMGRYSGPPMADVAGLSSLASLLSQARWTIPSQFRNAGDMLNLIMMASALDIAVPTALGNLFYSDTGVPTMRGRLALALIMRAGHRVTYPKIGDHEAEVVIERIDGHSSGSATWTIGEAMTAGLTTKQRSPWAAYPSDMLFWRALSRAARRYCPDIMAGFYLAEEIADLNAGYQAPDHLDQVAEAKPTDLDLTAKVDTIVATIAKIGDTGVVLDADGTPALKDDITRGRLRTAWYEAGNGNLMDAIAYEHDGQPVPLRTMIETLGAKYDATVKARQAQAQQASINVDHDDGLPISPDNQAPISTPSGNLPCGCDADTVLVSGQHTCRTAPTTAGAGK